MIETDDRIARLLIFSCLISCTVPGNCLLVLTPSPAFRDVLSCGSDESLMDKMRALCMEL